MQPFMERRLHILDSSGANNIHGLPGILSAIAAAIAAGIAGHDSSNGFIDYGNRYAGSTSTSRMRVLNCTYISLGSHGSGQYS